MSSKQGNPSRQHDVGICSNSSSEIQQSCPGPVGSLDNESELRNAPYSLLISLLNTFAHAPNDQTQMRQVGSNFQ